VPPQPSFTTLDVGHPVRAEPAPQRRQPLGTRRPGRRRAPSQDPLPCVPHCRSLSQHVRGFVHTMRTSTRRLQRRRRPRRDRGGSATEFPRRPGRSQGAGGARYISAEHDQLVDQADRLLEENDFAAAMAAYRAAALAGPPASPALTNLGVAEDQERLGFWRLLRQKHPTSLVVRLGGGVRPTTGRSTARPVSRGTRSTSRPRRGAYAARASAASSMTRSTSA
jgi:hypothetical protein